MTGVFVMACDHRLVVPLGVAVAALGRHAPAGTRLVVLQEGIGPEDQAWVAAEGDDLDVSFVEVTPDHVAGMTPPPHLPVATFYRLVAPDLLDADVDRMAYLDVDLLVRHDPTPLLAVGTGGHGIAAVRDQYRPWVGGRPALPWRERDVGPSMPYLNAGVLVVDIAAWREQQVGERCVDLLRDHPLPWADQDALNLVLAGRWEPLDPRWNVQTDLLRDVALGWAAEDATALEAARADPAIVHFTGPEKPWHLGPGEPLRDEWHATLAATARAGWSPARPGRAATAVRRVRRRLGRAVSGR